MKTRKRNKTEMPIKHTANRPKFLKTVAGVLVLCITATLAGSGAIGDAEDAFARVADSGVTGAEKISFFASPVQEEALDLYAEKEDEPSKQTETDVPKTTTKTIELPPTTKETVSDPWNRESILITDIYARGGGILESDLPQSPVTQEQFAQYYEYMKGNNLYEIDIPISANRIKAAGTFRNVQDAATFCARDLGITMTAVYPELLHCNSYTYEVSYNSSRIHITVADKTSQVQHNNYVEQYNAAVKRGREIVTQVAQTVSNSATEKEMATALIYALADVCKYDDSMGILGCSAYGALVEGLASCTGYTAAYSMLLKIAGIDCVSLKSEPHAWTALRLDGEICWADATLFDNRDTETYDDEYKPGTDMNYYKKTNFEPIQIETEKIYKYWTLRSITANTVQE